jgi:uncharacterized protein DUF4276
MTRLLVHVEGQTEEDFVNEVLSDHLVNKGYESVSARIVGNSRLKRRRGGIRPWPSVRKDIINHLRQDRECVATTMVDFYGLPKHGDGAWPGRGLVANRATQDKAAFVEEALLASISTQMGASFDSRRFVPFVMMHEFEGLLFSDCEAFSRGVGKPELEPTLRGVRNTFRTPEDINDSPDTAPSKRVEAIVPGYEKPFLGTLAVLEIGLDRIRAECPHFSAWLKRLESLVPWR